MKIIIQGLEDDPRWAFRKIPSGQYEVPAMIEPDEDEAYTVQWPVELTEEGTLYYASAIIPHNRGPLEFIYWWRAAAKSAET